MDCLGVVTAINKNMWTFEISNKFLVHMPHLAVFKNAQLPTLGDTVEVKRAHYIKASGCMHLFISSRRNFKNFCEKSKKNDSPLLRLIRSCKLGYTDLLEISSNIDSLKVLSNTLQDTSVDILMIAIAKIVAEANSDVFINKKDLCMNKIIPRFSLSTVSKHKYVDINSSSVEAPYWSYGTHFKTKSSEYLVGFLFVNHIYGITMLKDDNHNMVCVILSVTKDKVRLIVNRFVLIRDYFVFTEIFKDSNTHNMEYLIVDYKNIEVIDCVVNISKDINFVQNPSICDYNECFKFKLLNKGTVSIDDKSLQIECLLKVELVDQEGQEIFLCLDVHYLNLIPFLECGNFYRVHHNKKLTKTHNYLMRKCASDIICYRFCEKNAIFVPLSQAAIRKHLSDFKEVVKREKTPYELLSFQALVKKKYFMEPLKNKSVRKKHYSFGTPGEKVHAIEFFEKGCDDSLVLYMHNWENLQMPLGLVPYMRIGVHHVSFYNGYCKPNPLSRIEVLSYEPPIRFQTCNLCEDGDNWGSPSFLGYGDLIPVGVLVWGRILSFSLKTLKISYQCVECKSLRIGRGPCRNCNENERNLLVNITAVVFDEMGQAKVICKNSELLRLILKMEPHQWRIWCKAFEQVGEYCYGADNYKTTNRKVRTFKDALSAALKAVNAAFISNLELKCRKLENSTNNDELPVWYCVDARETPQ